MLPDFVQLSLQWEAIPFLPLNCIFLRLSVTAAGVWVDLYIYPHSLFRIF